MFTAASTVFLMHLLDLQIICPRLKPVIIKFVPERRPRKERPGEGRDRGQPQTIDNQGERVREAIETESNPNIKQYERSEEGHTDEVPVFRSVENLETALENEVLHRVMKERLQNKSPRFKTCRPYHFVHCTTRAMQLLWIN